MRIIIATGIYPPAIGGPATYSELLANRLPAFGFEPIIIDFGTVKHWPRVIRHFVFFWRVFWTARSAKMIYAQDPVSVGLPSAVAAMLRDKPLFLRVPGDYAWEQAVQRFGVIAGIDDFQDHRYGWRTECLRVIQKWVAGRARRIITPSHYFRQLVSRWVKSPERVITIYNGIDLNNIHLITGAKAIEAQTIISAGRLVPWKGFEALIGFMQDLPDWKLYIAGEGPDKDKLARAISDGGLSGRVFLLGQLTRPELFQKVTSCEIFALNTHFESFCFQVVEAMYLGTPVITTKIGNLAEIINDGKEGLLIEPDSRPEFLKAVARLHRDKLFRERCVTAARKKSLSFGLDNTLRQLTTVLAETK